MRLSVALVNIVFNTALKTSKRPSLQSLGSFAGTRSERRNNDLKVCLRRKAPLKSQSGFASGFGVEEVSTECQRSRKGALDDDHSKGTAAEAREQGPKATILNVTP